MYFGSSFSSILGELYCCACCVCSTTCILCCHCVCGWAVTDVLKDLGTLHQWRCAMFIQNTRNHLPHYTQSPFVACMSQRAQSGRRTSLGIRVEFIGSTQSSLCLCIDLCLRCKVWTWSVNQIITLIYKISLFATIRNEMCQSVCKLRCWTRKSQ